MSRTLDRREVLRAVCAATVGAAWPSWATEGESPRALAQRLASLYPARPSLGYVAALVLSAQRHCDAQHRLPLASQALVQGWRDAAVRAPLPGDWPQRAGFAVFAEAALEDGDAIARELARQALLSAVVDTPAGARLSGLRPWTDDLFMAALLVDRTRPALGTAEQARVDQALAGTLDDGSALLQRAGGLFDHAAGSPVAWGRGNGFASLALAMGLAGPLRGLDERALAPLRERLALHLRAMLRLQGEDGLWRQVLDAPGSAPELTVSAMTVTALALARRSGVLAGAAVDGAVSRGWAALRRHVDLSAGSFSEVCASTPAGPDLAFYLQRPLLTGRDDRAAAMVLWAALAVAA